MTIEARTPALTPAQELWRLIDDMDHDVDSVGCCALLLHDYLEDLEARDPERHNAHVMIVGHLLTHAHKLDEAHKRMHKLAASLPRADEAA